MDRHGFGENVHYFATGEEADGFLSRAILHKSENKIGTTRSEFLSSCLQPPSFLLQVHISSPTKTSPTKIPVQLMHPIVSAAVIAVLILVSPEFIVVLEVHSCHIVTTVDERCATIAHPWRA